MLISISPSFPDPLTCMPILSGLSAPLHWIETDGSWNPPPSDLYRKSEVLYHVKSRAESKFNGTEVEIWAGFRPVGSTEKKLGPIMSNF